MDRLNSAFLSARRDFLTRWDRAHCWGVRAEAVGVKYIGYCDSDARTIRVNPSIVEDGDEDGLDLLIAHEISHAVAGAQHGERWQSRFLKVVERAEKRGREALADAVRREVEIYRNTPRVTAQYVYGRLKELVFDGPAVPSRGVARYSADEWGMAPDELRRRYPRFGRVLRRARAEITAYLEAEERRGQLPLLLQPRVELGRGD